MIAEFRNKDRKARQRVGVSAKLASTQTKYLIFSESSLVELSKKLSESSVGKLMFCIVLKVRNDIIL